MQFTEEQLEAARAELSRREQARQKQYRDEYMRRQQESEDRFWTGLMAQYPDIDRDTMYDIYAQCRDFFD